jgi:hypothetical protein
MSMASQAQTWQIVGEAGETTATYDPATSNSSGIVFVCAHGAGGQINDRSILAISQALRGHGISVVRFNFFYRERKSGRPDPMPQLMDCFSAVVAAVREQLNPRLLLIGGRSMGGRAASMLAADKFACDGLLLLAYPLHPPGRPGQLRVRHLPAIDVPVLCFNGTRDPFCDRRLMEQVVGPLAPTWTMRWLEGADHSFHVLKRSGTSDAAILETVASTSAEWARYFGGSATS